MLYLFGAFDAALAHLPTRRVFCDHRIDFSVADIEPFGPDIAVFEPVPEWNGNRGTFVAAEFGARPLLVVEVTSPSTRKNDVGIKIDLYERCAVPLYVIIDRQSGEDGTTLTLWAYHLGPNGYETVEVDDQGRLWLDPVKLWLGLVDGRAACFDAAGRRILPAVDLAKQAAEMTARLEEEAESRRESEERLRTLGEALNQRNEQQRAAVQELREAEQARREAEQARQAAELARHEAEQRAEQAEAALRALQEEFRRRNGS
jgi:flagellar biosynthesis GTPase FlhF